MGIIMTYMSHCRLRWNAQYILLLSRHTWLVLMATSCNAFAICLCSLDTQMIFVSYIYHMFCFFTFYLYIPVFQTQCSCGDRYMFFIKHNRRMYGAQRSLRDKRVLLCSEVIVPIQTTLTIFCASQNGNYYRTFL